jgi:hypothetical protein
MKDKTAWNSVSRVHLYCYIHVDVYIIVIGEICQCSYLCFCLSELDILLLSVFMY